MDSEDVTLDWGANEDDEVLTTPIKSDAATMSGAESLLALASGSGKNGGKNKEDNGNLVDDDDKDSDVVSLGGDDNDMDELYAYQSRTHLGGMPANVANSAQPAKRLPRHESATDKTLSERPPSPPHSVVVAASQSPDPTSSVGNGASPRSNNVTLGAESKSNGNRMMDDSLSTGKKSRSGSHSELARPSSLANTLPPPGTHGLPPKPIAAAMTAPFVRPSHPSIMSASTMREREHDLRRAASPKRGRRPYSPDGDAPLAPGWEMRIARDGSNDRYYYNSKTDQSTWNRQVAAGLIPPPSPSSPPYYSRDLPGRRSPDHDNVRRGRSSRYEPSSDRALSPRLSFNDRHYSPPKSSSGLPPLSSRSDRGDYPQHSRGNQRTSSPEIISPRSISRRGNDRDMLSGSNRPRLREDKAPSYAEEQSAGRANEKVIERARSRSLGRERYDSRRISPKEGRPDLVSGSYDDRDSKDRTGPSSRYHTALPSVVSQLPPLSPPIKQPYPPDRYIVPSPDTFRPWAHSPQASAPERPPKRMRSPRSPARHADYRSLPSQPLLTRWGPEYDGNKARNETNSPRDRTSPISGPPILIPSAKYMEREERRGRDSDAKRQKIADDLDSTPARRPLPADADAHDTRENGRPYGRSQPRDGPTTGAPVGPRRRDNMPPRRAFDSYRPEPPPDVRSRNDAQDAQSERNTRGLDRERENSRSDLPTGPRAMELPSNEPDLGRHGPSNHGYQRSVSNRVPAEHALSSNSGPGNRANNQPPPSEDNRQRQRDRNNNRRDDRPRGGGESRYTPSNNSRYDSPPYSPGPDFNNLPAKSRFGDFYRPNERTEDNNNRDRMAPRDGRRSDVGQERYRPPAVEERARAISNNSRGRSRSPLPVVNRSNSFLSGANAAEIQPKRKENVQLLESIPTDSEARYSRREGQTTEAEAESLPRVAGDRDDAVMVEDTSKADTTSASVNDVSITPMEVDSKVVPGPSPSASGNMRKRQNKLSDVSRSEPSNGDLTRQIHQLPPKPALRQGSSSLLDRLSNPGPTNSNQAPTPLRDRVAGEPSSSKSQGPSLRDRLDSYPNAKERKNEDQPQQRHGNHNWRNNRSRKGRG